MVDLRPGESALPEGHPWNSYPRWRIALHALLGVTLAGMLIGMAVGISALPDLAGYVNIVLIGATVFGAALGLICALIAAVLSSRLRGWYPYSQSLPMGAIAVAVLIVVVFGMAAVNVSQHGISQAGLLWGTHLSEHCG